MPPIWGQSGGREVGLRWAKTASRSLLPATALADIAGAADDLYVLQHMHNISLVHLLLCWTSYCIDNHGGQDVGV